MISKATFFAPTLLLSATEVRGFHYPEPEGGWERMQNGVLSAYKVFPDVLLEVSHVVANSDWASFEGMISGTFRGGKWFVGRKERTLPPTNRHVKLSTAWFFQVNSDGLVTYWSFYWDNFQFLAQIGLRPEQIGMAAGTAFVASWERHGKRAMRLS